MWIRYVERASARFIVIDMHKLKQDDTQARILLASILEDGAWKRMPWDAYCNIPACINNNNNNSFAIWYDLRIHLLVKLVVVVAMEYSPFLSYLNTYWKGKLSVASTIFTSSILYREQKIVSELIGSIERQALSFNNHYDHSDPRPRKMFHFFPLLSKLDKNKSFVCSFLSFFLHVFTSDWQGLQRCMKNDRPSWRRRRMGTRSQWIMSFFVFSIHVSKFTSLVRKPSISSSAPGGSKHFWNWGNLCKTILLLFRPIA